MKRSIGLSRDAVYSLFGTVALHTGFGALYTSLQTEEVYLDRGVNAFCTFCLRHAKTAPLCRYACRQATLQSLLSGEAYFQRCWAGLFYTTAVIAPGDLCHGGISLGGFHGAGELDDIHAAVQEQIQELPAVDRAGFRRRLCAIREITPADLRGLGVFLMEATLSSGINSDRFFQRQREKYIQQRSIAEAFQDIQENQTEGQDILADTYHFIQILQRKNRTHTMEFISGYLARVLAMSRWNLTKLKAHARVLLAVMTSQEIMDGADWEIATTRESRHMRRVMTCASTEDCCLEIADVVLRRLDRTHGDRRGYGSVSDRVRHWMEQHFAEPVDLAVMARAVGASPSTVVHQLKQETGKTSRQLLTEIRVAEAKRLLATSSLEISAIANLCGFYDQSHFTKLFKSIVNLTPGRFRTLLHFAKEDV